MDEQVNCPVCDWYDLIEEDGTRGGCGMPAQQCSEDCIAEGEESRA